jgi:hypothetical protein
MGCEDSAKAKHCANHVTPLSPELLFSSCLRNVIVKFRLRIVQVFLTDPKTIQSRVILVIFSLCCALVPTLCVHKFQRPSGYCIASNRLLALQQNNSNEQQQQKNQSGYGIIITQSF